MVMATEALVTTVKMEIMPMMGLRIITSFKTEVQSQVADKAAA